MKIVIVGGGTAGWMTASTLIKAFPSYDISVIEPKDSKIIGVGESTLGHIRRWTRFIEINEKDFLKYVDGSYKMSIKFTDFYKKDSGSFHYPFGKPITIDERNPFSDWHIKKYLYPETKNTDMVECLFSSAQLFLNNKFSTSNVFDNFDPYNDVAYHFDSYKFGKYLKENVCIPNGVKIIEKNVKKALMSDNGVDLLILENEEAVRADLFIDCTGFKSMLLGSALKTKFISYEKNLPNNRAWATKVEYIEKEKELEPFTNCTAIENGWCWNIPLWSRLGAGYVYSDKFLDPEKAKEEFKNYLMSNKMVIPRTKEQVESLEFNDIKMKIGIYEKTFVKNVVAIGLSAGFIEPLESNGLFTVHQFLFKLVDVLQRGEISQFDRDMYNVSTKDLYDSFAKFVSLHYALSHRDDTEYWREIKNKSFSDDYDPFFPYVGRSSGIYDLIYKYMDYWAHPNDNSGISYISTGMNIDMINSSRMEFIRYGNKGVTIEEEIDFINNIWKSNIKKWKQESDKSKTLFKYLDENFYS